MAWDMAKTIGYEPITTFWDDFSIAESFGVNAIYDTYSRAFNAWNDDIKYITELAMVLNHKIWRWHGYNDDFAKTYETLWRRLDNYCLNKFKGDDLRYFLSTLN